jgi:hypothetical protein
VAPTGELVATPERGTLMGNRGCLHDEHAVVVRHHAGRRWIACLLDYKGVRRAIMRPHRYTELFFLDEATALAAGHRPCAYCRRRDYRRFRDAWATATGTPADASVDAVDAVLHAERVTGRSGKVTHERPWSALPDATIVAGPTAESARLVLGDSVLPWSFGGYGPPEPRPASGWATVLTPRSIVETLAAGYRPGVHPTVARAPGGR